MGHCYYFGFPFLDDSTIQYTSSKKKLYSIIGKTFDTKRKWSSIHSGNLHVFCIYSLARSCTGFSLFSLQWPNAPIGAFGCTPAEISFFFFFFFRGDSSRDK